MQILLVEDDTSLADGLCKALRNEGFVPNHVAEGLAALHVVETDPPDIVVLDLGLPDVDGLEVLPLHEHQREHVALVRWAPNTRFQPHWHQGGEEILVVEGEFCDEHGVYPAGSWIRSPDQSQHAPFTGDDGALIYVKVGHLS